MPSGRTTRPGRRGSSSNVPRVDGSMPGATAATGTGRATPARTRRAARDLGERPMSVAARASASGSAREASSWQCQTRTLDPGGQAERRVVQHHGVVAVEPAAMRRPPRGRPPSPRRDRALRAAQARLERGARRAQLGRAEERPPVHLEAGAGGERQRSPSSSATRSAPAALTCSRRPPPAPRPLPAASRRRAPPRRGHSRPARGARWPSAAGPSAVSLLPGGGLRDAGSGGLLRWHAETVAGSALAPAPRSVAMLVSEGDRPADPGAPHGRTSRLAGACRISPRSPPRNPSDVYASGRASATTVAGCAPPHGPLVTESGWPDDHTSCRAVGPHTRRGDRAVAFGEPVLPADVNVRRMLERTGGSFGPEAADALMDLGATVCIARRAALHRLPAGRRLPGARAPLRRRAPPGGPFEGSFRQRRARRLRSLAAGPRPPRSLDEAALSAPRRRRSRGGRGRRGAATHSVDRVATGHRSRGLDHSDGQPFERWGA